MYLLYECMENFGLLVSAFLLGGERDNLFYHNLVYTTGPSVSKSE